MTDAALRVSIRRMTVLLLVPLSLLVLQFGIHLREQHGITGGWQSQVIVVSWAISGLCLVGAAVYLSSSSLAALAPVND